MQFHYFFEYALRLRDVVRVRDAKDEIDSACRLRSHVFNYVAPYSAVRNHHCLVVKRLDDCVDETHVLDFARHAASFDHVTDVVRPVEQDHHAGGEIAQRVLKCKADDEAQDAKAGEKRPE